jgi:hypothetical protein
MNSCCYEVEVEILTGSQHYGNYVVEKTVDKRKWDRKDRHYRLSEEPAFKGVQIKEKIVKMFNFENCTRQQAIEKGKKKGIVKTCRKVDEYEDLLSIEHIQLDQVPLTVYDKGNQYVSPIAMSEMVWQKKKNIKKPLDTSES